MRITIDGPVVTLEWTSDANSVSDEVMVLDFAGTVVKSMSMARAKVVYMAGFKYGVTYTAKLYSLSADGIKSAEVTETFTPCKFFYGRVYAGRKCIYAFFCF